jgi:hypothetical protein
MHISTIFNIMSLIYIIRVIYIVIIVDVHTYFLLYLMIWVSLPYVKKDLLSCIIVFVREKATNYIMVLNIVYVNK